MEVYERVEDDQDMVEVVPRHLDVHLLGRTSYTPHRAKIR
jgi:hypothetical protein